MNITDPIIIPELCWTKQSIYERLEDLMKLEFGPEAITDEQAIWWVREENEIRDETDSEEEYVAQITELSAELISAIEETR